jgi:hypothetical protein
MLNIYQHSSALAFIGLGSFGQLLTAGRCLFLCEAFSKAMDDTLPLNLNPLGELSLCVTYCPQVSFRAGGHTAGCWRDLC